MSIKIVTDSTCDLPKPLLEKHGIKVIPVYIHMGNESYLDRVDITREDFYERLPNFETPPTTAAPGPEIFYKTYQDLSTQGATEVLSIHISSSLSNVLDAARLGARQTSSVPVTVYDSGQLSLGVGFSVLEAAKFGANNLPLEEILKRLDDLRQRTYVFAILDTLEYLRRSGRMSGIMAGLGGLLKIKPILKMHNGAPSAERVRTRERAIQRVFTLVEKLGPLERIDLVHTNAREGAQDLYQRTRDLFPEDHQPLSVDVTPVIGAHIGPGAVGVACITRAK